MDWVIVFLFDYNFLLLQYNSNDNKYVYTYILTLNRKWNNLLMQRHGYLKSKEMIAIQFLSWLIIMA